MSGEMPKKDSFESTGELLRQDIPVEFVGDQEERIDVKQTKEKKKKEVGKKEENS